MKKFLFLMLKFNWKMAETVNRNEPILLEESRTMNGSFTVTQCAVYSYCAFQFTFIYSKITFFLISHAKQIWTNWTILRKANEKSAFNWINSTIRKVLLTTTTHLSNLLFRNTIKKKTVDSVESQTHIPLKFQSTIFICDFNLFFFDKYTFCHWKLF